MPQNVRSTSVEAYHAINPLITGHQCNQILNAMRSDRDYSLTEIASATGLRNSSISARVNAMKRVGALIECPKRYCSVTGRKVIPVRLAVSSKCA